MVNFLSTDESLRCHVLEHLFKGVCSQIGKDSELAEEGDHFFELAFLLLPNGPNIVFLMQSGESGPLDTRDCGCSSFVLQEGEFAETTPIVQPCDFFHSSNRHGGDISLVIVSNLEHLIVNVALTARDSPIECF